ncbi:MAG: right-handed parallel beta-helix repeat-containing protein [Planctomycetota bacterium]|jgi:parallel beta-helix repeat protein
MKNSGIKRFINVHLLLAAAVLTCCGSVAFAADWTIPGNLPPGTVVDNGVYTLTQDVSGSIEIAAHDLTLDGAGYTVTGTAPYGILLLARTGVTVQNVAIQGFGAGIYLASSPGNFLTCNTVSSTNGEGIWLDYSSNNTLNGNTVSGNHRGIFVFYQSNMNTITGNTMSTNDNGIVVQTSNNNQVYSNNFIDNTIRQAYVISGTGNVFNLATGGNYWDDCLGCTSYVFEGGVDNMPLADPVSVSCGMLVVDIDIKPGSYPNAINLDSHGLIPVAILSSTEFDATTVDPETVELAGAGVAVRGKSNKYMAQQEDVNGDGLVDLVNHVATENLDPDSLQDGYAVLTATTFGGQEITGKDEITIVPPE